MRNTKHIKRDFDEAINVPNEVFHDDSERKLQWLEGVYEKDGVLYHDTKNHATGQTFTVVLDELFDAEILKAYREYNKERIAECILNNEKALAVLREKNVYRDVTKYYEQVANDFNNDIITIMTGEAKQGTMTFNVPESDKYLGWFNDEQLKQVVDSAKLGAGIKPIDLELDESMKDRINLEKQVSNGLFDDVVNDLKARIEQVETFNPLDHESYK